MHATDTVLPRIQESRNLNPPRDREICLNPGLGDTSDRQRPPRTLQADTAQEAGIPFGVQGPGLIGLVTTTADMCPACPG